MDKDIAKKHYNAMIRELVDDGVTEFDSVEPSMGEIIALAKFGIMDDAEEIALDAAVWHLEGWTAAKQAGLFGEANRLWMDGLRIVMGDRYDQKSHKFTPGPVQIDIEAEIERRKFDNMIEAIK